MNPIARDLAALRHAARETRLDGREKQFLDDAGAKWDVREVEIFCSIAEKIREAGFLSADREPGDEALLIHKDPEDWGYNI